jgi:hypothetical protein
VGKIQDTHNQRQVRAGAPCQCPVSWTGLHTTESLVMSTDTDRDFQLLNEMKVPVKRAAYSDRTA